MPIDRHYSRFMPGSTLFVRGPVAAPFAAAFRGRKSGAPIEVGGMRYLLGAVKALSAHGDRDV